MNVTKIILCFLGSVLLSLQLVPHIFAQSYIREAAFRMAQKQYQDVKGIRVGDAASLKVLISQEAQYDSNIFLTPTDEKHDLISITSPKFLLNLPIGRESRHLFQAMYKADIAAFSNFKSQNYVDQELLAKLNLALPFGYLNVQNDFRDTVDRSSTEFTDQVRRNENLSQVVLGVEKNKLTYQAGYTHFLRDYHDDDLENLNYTEDVFTGTAFYQVFSKTKALLEYDHGLIDYSDDVTRSGDYDQIRTGFKTELSAKTDGIVKLGYQQRKYDTGSREGFEGFVAQAGINANFSDSTNISFNYLNTAVESITSNNNFYKLNYISGTLTQKLVGHFSLILETQYERRRYPEVDPGANIKRRDSVFTEASTLQYSIKEWGKINVGYEYTTDISNIDANDYKDHVVSLRFDFLI